jgi:type VI secretion system secreted protein Hcp
VAVASASVLVTATVLTLSMGAFGGDVAVAGAAAPRPRALPASSSVSLSIPGIAGDGTDLSPTDIAASSFSWGVQNSPSTTKAGKASFSNLSLTKPIDSASPLLFQAAAAHTLFPTVTLRIYPPKGTKGDSETITLSGVRIAGEGSIGGAGANASGGAIVETVSLNFTKIKVDYTSSATGKVTHGGWDLATNKKA